MQFTYHLTADDFHTLQQKQQSLISGWGKFRAFARGFLIVLFAFWLFTNYARYAYLDSYWLMQLAVLVILMISTFSLARWGRSGRHLQWWLNQSAGRFELTMTRVGLSFVDERGRVAELRWSDISGLEVDRQHNGIWLYFQSPALVFIPLRDFTDEADSQAFIQQLRSHWSSYPSNHHRVLMDSFASSRPLVLRDIFHNLKLSFSLVCLRSVNVQAFTASDLQLRWGFWLYVLLVGFTQYLTLLPQTPEFNFMGVLAVVMQFVVLLLASVLVSSLLLQRSQLLRQLVISVYAAIWIAIPYFVCLNLLIGEHVKGEMPVSVWINAFFGVWLLMVFVRIIQLLYQQAAPMAWYLASSLVFWIFLVQLALPNAVIYYPSYDDVISESESVHRPEIDAEAVFYQQPTLLSNALAQVKPSVPKRNSLYFLGFAGQADEKVFANEVNFARGLLDKQFGTEARSLVLLNSFESVEHTPVANTHNLDLALKGFAQRMDKQRDVLFLYLSSHGAKNHQLSVSFGSMSLNDLSAEKLKELLDKHGIVNRVIVVSACYSGGFLDVLKDEHSLIMTASSRDHVSYGCGDWTEYTYFGQAYFVDALSKQTSFVQAFNAAFEQIKAREKSEGLDHSNPQIHIGKQIEPILAKLEKS